MHYQVTALAAALSISVLTATSIAADAPPAAPATQPARKVRAAEDGSVLLHAKDVTIHGTTVRYEPQPNKNTVGYWTRKDDWVSWELETAKPGRYHVLVLQGCGKGSGGAEVEFQFAGAAGDGGGDAKDHHTLKMTVEDTGGFQNFVSRDIGTIDLPAGAYTLSVKPLSKPGLAVMDLRSITLKPAADEKGEQAESPRKS
jgi:hypothetical protein